MALKRTNRAPIEVSSRVLDWLVEDQYRRFKETGQEPKQAELIREVIEAVRHPERLESISDEERSIHLSEETRSYIQLLVSVLESCQQDNVAAVQQNLHKIYLTQQATVLETARQKSRLQAATVISGFLRSGAALRWGEKGWEIERMGTLLTPETIAQLNELGFISPESPLERGEEGSNEFVRDLLSNQGIEGLDEISRRAFRANQHRAYFEYLNELRGLYQQHSTLREGDITYPELVREKFRLLYHFAWLYLAGVLHLLGITEALRLQLAQSSLEAVGSLIE